VWGASVPGKSLSCDYQFVNCRIFVCRIPDIAGYAKYCPTIRHCRISGTSLAENAIDIASGYLTAVFRFRHKREFVCFMQHSNIVNFAVTVYIAASHSSTFDTSLVVFAMTMKNGATMNEVLLELRGQTFY